MTADEIRASHNAAANTITGEHIPGLQVAFISELAAQVAELNEARKPRWVNLSTTPEPCLVDATHVAALSCGMNAGQPCVFVRLRGVKDEMVVLGLDHDDVRGKLGINEDWIQPPAPYTPPGTISVSSAEWNAATNAIADARLLLETVSADAPHAETLRKSIATFDDFSMPF